MEALFVPLERGRYRRTVHNDLQRPPAPPERVLTELRLRIGATFGDLAALGTGFCTWETFLTLVYDKIVWMTDHLYISSLNHGNSQGHRYILGLEEQGSSDRKGIYIFASAMEGDDHTTTTVNFLVGLLARSETVSRVCVRCVGWWVFSAPSLAHFLQERHGNTNLKELTLDMLYLNEEHCLVLSTAESPDLKIKLSTCALEASAVDAFVDCLQRSKGPTELYELRIPALVMARALSGNTRVKRVILDQSQPDAPGMAALAAALSENLGLEVLDFYRQPFDDSSWTTLCNSLRTHPTLYRVDLARTTRLGPSGRPLPMSDEQKTLRMNAMVDMLRDNVTLRTIVLSPEECNEQILRKQIRPRLVMNKHRRRFHAIKELRGELRRKVLGRTIGLFRNNTNILWWLLSSNADAAFPMKDSSSARPTSPEVAMATGKRKRT